MSTPFSPATTAPGAADTSEAASPLPSFALVILWSAKQPHRAGEVAFCPSFEWVFVGRGDAEIEKFALFGPHRPGEPLATTPAGFLDSPTVSKRQLRFHATAVALEMEQVGQCVTLVNGEEVRRATLQPGDTVMLRKEVLLLVVRRHKTLPMPAGMGPLHPFGQQDADKIVGEGPEAWQLRADIRDAADGHQNVMVRGETGSGKELTAAAIHRHSDRANAPYVEHNAAGFTISLLETELFGHVADFPNKGMPARPGLFGSAEGGTLFLDEIGDCPAEAQAQLLRTLQQGTYKPVGESVARRIDVRVVGATHQDNSHFRNDLRGRFPRTVRVPPLRERREDIPLLLVNMLRQLAQKKKDAPAKRFFDEGPAGELLQPRISLRLIEHIVRQPLPLNMRDLEAIVLRAIDASPGDELKLPPSSATAPPALKEEAPSRQGRPEPSKAEVLACLEAVEWNVSRAGRRLGVHRNVVYRLMETYGLQRDKTGT